VTLIFAGVVFVVVRWVRGLERTTTGLLRGLASNLTGCWTLDLLEAKYSLAVVAVPCISWSLLSSQLYSNCSTYIKKLSSHFCFFFRGVDRAAGFFGLCASHLLAACRRIGLLRVSLDKRLIIIVAIFDNLSGFFEDSFVSASSRELTWACAYWSASLEFLSLPSLKRWASQGGHHPLHRRSCEYQA
jgi:hypothetical protein